MIQSYNIFKNYTNESAFFCFLIIYLLTLHPYMSPKVTIIIAVYNCEKYLNTCARSLFEQTLDGIEYIFVNDATPDDSIIILNSIIEEYPTRKPFVKIINMDKNGGVSKARRIGVENATGEYVIHADSDDWVDRDMY